MQYASIILFLLFVFCTPTSTSLTYANVTDYRLSNSTELLEKAIIITTITNQTQILYEKVDPCDFFCTQPRITFDYPRISRYSIYTSLVSPSINFISGDGAPFNAFGPNEYVQLLQQPVLEGNANITPALIMQFNRGACYFIRFSIAFNVGIDSPVQLTIVRIVDELGRTITSDRIAASVSDCANCVFQETVIDVQFTSRAAYAEVSFQGSATRYAMDNFATAIPAESRVYMNTYPSSSSSTSGFPVDVVFTPRQPTSYDLDAQEIVYDAGGWVDASGAQNGNQQQQPYGPVQQYDIYGNLIP